jgi:hypothetical protein
MAKNDTIILDGILDERIALNLPSNKRDEAFEYFAIEQILKDANLSKDDILSGRIDGRNDGGIDGFYILVNGHLLSDSDSFFWPRTNADLEIHIITCKHHDTFKQAPFDNITATLTEVLDFSIEKKDLKGSYNDELLRYRELLKAAYRKLAPRLTSFMIKVSYASRGDALILGESIISRGNQIKEIGEQLFGACNTLIQYFGSTELVELNRRVPNFSLELPFISVLGRGERYVLLSKLNDYYKFICDDSKKLRRYLFDSNVRDFMGLNRVNEDIKATLENESSPDFWWLNNGITILATSAKVIGNSIHIEDIQIVNGLQSTESIYKYFSSGKLDVNERAVLVKIIVSKEPEIRDSIIRATNNQTLVELSALRATDKIQRDIEDVLLLNDVYYERRTNYYLNQGVKPSLIVTPLYLAAGYLSLILKHPDSAAQLKSKFMRSPESYDKIFSENVSLDVWPQIAKVLKLTDSVLETLRPVGQSSTENFLKKWRHIISYITISRLIGKFDFGAQDLINFDLNKYVNSVIIESWQLIHPIESQPNSRAKWLKKEFILNIFNVASVRYNITGLDGFIGRANWSVFLSTRRFKQYKSFKDVSVTDEFIEKINKLLPDQPWKPGTHLRLAKELNCSQKDIYEAVNILISKGIRFKQKNGVIYDLNDKVIGFDSERVDNVTMKLKDL